MTTEHKIVFTGTMGVGKTTAIGALSEIPPVVTDAVNTDETSSKATTTVAMDYGEFTIDGDEKVRLVGTPGQVRFEFMWKILATGALGIVLLVDNSRPDPIDDMLTYLGHFRSFAERGRMVVGVSRTESHPQPAVDHYYEVLDKEGLNLPVLSGDVRRSQDVLILINALLSEIEFE